MVGPGGFEPPSSWLKTRRPSPLDHGPTATSLLYPNHRGLGQGGGRVFGKWGRFLPPLGLIRVHRVDPKTPKQRGLLESPLTPPSPPLLKGGEGAGVGGSACEKPLRRAEHGWLVYTLIRNHAGAAIFSNTLRGSEGVGKKSLWMRGWRRIHIGTGTVPLPESDTGAVSAP
jgi:hypothetical protein